MGTTARPAYAIWVFFLGPIRRDRSEIANLAAFGYSGERNEVNSVGALDGTVTLSESTDFFTIGVDSNGSVAALAHFAVFRNFAGVRIDCVAVKGIMLLQGAAWKWRLGGASVVDEECTCTRRDMLQVFRSCSVGVDCDRPSGDANATEFAGMHCFGWSGRG